MSEADAIKRFKDQKKVKDDKDAADKTAKDQSDAQARTQARTNGALWAETEATYDQMLTCTREGHTWHFDIGDDVRKAEILGRYGASAFQAEFTAGAVDFWDKVKSKI